ncbi:hypothetical protein GO495_06465 [Chitinophaga oryziterrae]|uniref:eRF1 domain-containing protein n=1 Tax=Chitinophaga oryziterrae TaxID=1031224 RepID=A0A6N8J4R4_9BACT|nr:hypothetical protein [Chitinophaga oryziterrae]MVT40217.1 hypothetical protein [Chitinophaga oryziterrae]
MEKTIIDNRVLTGEELIRLVQKEKGNICISIIVPTHKLSPERRVDRLQVEKAVMEAKKYLSYNYGKEEIKPLQQSIDELFGQVDFNHNSEGIGLYVSANIKELVQFHFPVREKVIINRSFEIRDLLYQAYYSLPYYTLLLTEKEARLFGGRLNSLSEIKDNDFPKIYVDDYEYARPSRGSSSVGNAFVREFEREKSQLEEIRFQHFSEAVDDGLKHYLTNHNIPLIIAGAKKDLSYFKMVNHHNKNIISELPGNYSHITTTELGKMTFELLRSFMDQSKQQLITDFEEKIGQGRGITGVPEIWKAAKEGNALKLLVEKDFSRPGFLTEKNEYNLHSQSPLKPHQVLADAINDLMEIVLEKNGQVILLENGTLQAHQRIGLITRY